MIGSYLIGIGGIVMMIILWVLVQSWWGQTFQDHLTDEDVLAGRNSCGNCGCMTQCTRRQ